MSKRTWLSAAAVGAAAAALLYRLRRPLIARRLDIPAHTHAVRVARGVVVPLRDGVRLSADLYQPLENGYPVAAGPVILIRTPYQKGDLLTSFNAQRFAERGYYVLAQDVRGMYESEGEFDSLRQEVADGADTVRWLHAQAWCNGKIGMWGPSYLGYIQWAAAMEADDLLSALMPVITSANIGGTMYGDGKLAFDLVARWNMLMDASVRARTVVGRMLAMSERRQKKELEPVWKHLPLATIDSARPRMPLPPFRQHPERFAPDHPYWDAIDLRPVLDRVTTPVNLIGGWHDIFTTDILQDYERLRRANREPHLTMGPWTHVDQSAGKFWVQEALDWFDRHLKGKPAGERTGARVKLYVMGADEWRTVSDWPPASRAVSWYLQPAGGLLQRGPESRSVPSKYTYDPGDPTPNLGGPMLMPPAGSVDNRELEARPDVLTFTTPPLAHSLEIIGWVKATLFVRSSAAHTDFAARLCDVYPDGRSMNVCDGLTRVWPGVGTEQPDGALQIEVNMSATAYRFAAGHRLRLQVSSALFPRFDRNLNSGEPPAIASTIVVAQQQIHHDETHPSKVTLPCM